MSIEFLLRRAYYGDSLSLDVAVHCLDAMGRGGMYDVVGGGFARYSTDNDWLVPHFEKMLYDNAQLARAYLHAALLTGERNFQHITERTLDFLLREMRHPQGGFYSSLDADSEGIEGKYYLWTPDEIRLALDSPEDFELASQLYDLRPGGNFEGRTILQQAISLPELAQNLKINLPELEVRLSGIHQALLQLRQGRVRPATDDKVLTSWNALALAAFAEAGRFLGRQDYLYASIQNAEFLTNQLRKDGVLLRSWRQGKAMHPAYLEDHAALILGLLALYQAVHDARWYALAHELADEMLAHFSDPNGGFFDTRDDQPDLIARPKDLQDNATPCGSSLAASALLQLAAFSGRSDWRRMAETMLAPIQNAAQRYPTAFGQWLCAADDAINPPLEIAILGDADDPLRMELVRAADQPYRPDLVLAVSDLPLPARSPALLQDRMLLNAQPTAYVCRNFSCQLPVNTAQQLSFQLDSAQPGSGAPD